MPWPSAVREVLDAFAAAGCGRARAPRRSRTRGASLASTCAALLHRHREHAVADAQHRHAEVPHRLRRAQVVRPRRCCAWLPDRMMPFGANSRMNASLTSFGWISQYTCASRTRRAISCVTWEPKSRIRILSCMAAGECQIRVRRRRARHAGARRAARGSGRTRSTSATQLQRGAEVERRADAPVAAAAGAATVAEQRRADDRREHRHQAVQRAHRAHRLALRAARRRRSR